MSIGILYRFDDEQFKAGVNYKLYRESATNCWGELTLVEDRPVGDGGGFVIKLEDNRKSRCYLKRRVNRAVVGIPPRFVYHFVGNGPLEQDSDAQKIS